MSIFFTADAKNWQGADYLNYFSLTPQLIIRQILSAALKDRVSRNTAYSLRAFARDLKISPGFMSEVLDGKKRLSMQKAEDISKLLNLSAARKKRLLKAVAESARESYSEEVSAMIATPGYGQNYKEFHADQFQYFNQWYHVAIADLITCKRFKNDPAWIAKRLNISESQVSIAIGRLLRLGLLKKTGGSLVKTDEYISIPTSLPMSAVESFHRQMINKALDHLAKTDASEFKRRNISSITFSISTSNIEEAKQKIMNFKREMAELSEEGNCDEVYQLNIQFFPLTTPWKVDK